MKGKRGICVLCLMALFAAVVSMQVVGRSAVAPVAAQKRARPTVSQTAIDVKALFNQRCAKCHATDGSANTIMGEVGVAPNFTDRRWQAQVSDRRMTNSIMRGRSGMPAFKGKLSQKQIKALVAYIREFNRGEGER